VWEIFAQPQRVVFARFAIRATDANYHHNSFNMSTVDSSSTNITAEHAQALRDLASNGSVDDSNIYGYSNAISNGQHNGIFTSI
jgi:hypothetical protein